jgi:uncharacterized Zn finger protein
MTTGFETAFSLEALRAYAWGRSFERGTAYAADGRVKRLTVTDREASATVRGSRAYRVRLWIEDGQPAFSCTCPVADDGLFCKHCVAVGLAASEAAACAAGDASGAIDDDRASGSIAAGARRTSAVDVRAYLQGLDKERLIDLLIEQADNDELLHGRLELQAAGAQGKGDGIDAFRSAIRDVIRPGDFIDYRSMYDYSRGVNDLIDSLTELLARGLAAEAIDLCELALTNLEDAMGSVDDSDGYMGTIRNRLCGLHREACLQARPDPVVLAERLFEWELHSEWDTFFDAAQTYADVLGDEGLAVYRRLAEEVWAGMRALAPGEREDYSTRRFRISHIMESLAQRSADVDALIAVKARDLSHPYNFVQIAEIFREADRHDDALAWAERGLAAYPDCLDVRLLEVLAEEYERCHREQDAVALMLSLLERRPVLDSYQRLKTHAKRAGRWKELRPAALDRLRGPTGSATPTPGRASGLQIYPGWWAGRSELVRALLWERDVDAAWEEARAGGCSGPLWMELAGARAKKHPEDALPIYQKEVERLIGQKDRRSYEAAIALLGRISELLQRLGKGDEFTAQVAAVRAAHKQKRSLVKLLDAAEKAGW